MGESLYETITRWRVIGGHSASYCDGGDFNYRPHERPLDPFSDGPYCGNCRVILLDNWFNKVNEETDGQSKRETDLLSSQLDNRNDLRLSCCVPVESWMEGLTFEIYTPAEISEAPKFIWSEAYSPSNISSSRNPSIYWGHCSRKKEKEHSNFLGLFQAGFLNYGNNFKLKYIFFWVSCE